MLLVNMKPRWTGLHVVNFPPSCWMFPVRDGTYIGRSALVCFLYVGSDSSEISFGENEAGCWNQTTTPTLLSWLFCSWGNCADTGIAKDKGCPHLLTVSTWFILLWILVLGINVQYNIFTFCAHSHRPITYLFPWYFDFSSLIFLRPLSKQINHFIWSMNSQILNCGYTLFAQNRGAGMSPEVLPIGKTSSLTFRATWMQLLGSTCPHLTYIHQPRRSFWTKLRLFPSFSAGHRHELRKGCQRNSERWHEWRLLLQLTLVFKLDQAPNQRCHFH